MLSVEQHDRLRSARDRIAAAPRTFRQERWGNTAEGCGTPCCVAGHIVADDAEAVARIRKAGSYRRAWLIATEAAKALGTARTPLFDSAWPKDWFTRAGIETTREGAAIPNANNAVAILDAIMDGRIDDAVGADTRVTDEATARC